MAGCFRSRRAHQWRSRAFFTCCSLLTLCALFLCPQLPNAAHSVAVAQDASPPAEQPGFSAIVREHKRQGIAAVEKYLADHPQADDRYEAAAWLLNAVREQALEPTILPLTSTLLDDPALPGRLRPHVLESRCLGLAESSDPQSALELYRELLASARFREPAGIVELSKQLGGRLLIAGHVDAARLVYEALAGKFFLNAEVRQFCDIRLARLELVGKPAPDFAIETLAGRAISPSAWQGKVVVLDFWATNCAPCLIEFPELKRIYRERHAAGLEILGLSLDEARLHVEMFQQEWNLPWDIAWSPPEVSRLREQYHVPLIPAVFVIDRRGRMTRFDVTGPALDRAVASLLTKEE